jgi:5-hydroxyisourate hydrolase
VLDTATGRPAANVPVRLERHAGSDTWAIVGEGHTDADGRLRSLLPEGVTLPHGLYRVIFDTADYLGDKAFFPEVMVVFAVHDDRHHHVPLLLSPFGYSTYRGS